MVRIGVSIYLMLATAVGPWFCCCTTMRLLGSVVPAESGGGGRSHSARAGCCHHKHQSKKLPEQNRSEKTPDRHDQPGQPSCPCQEHGPGSPALACLETNLSKQSDVQRVLHGLLADLGATLPPSGELAPDFLSPGDSPALPFLTAGDLLYAHHLLRC